MVNLLARIFFSGKSIQPIEERLADENRIACHSTVIALEEAMGVKQGNVVAFKRRASNG